MAQYSHTEDGKPLVRLDDGPEAVPVQKVQLGDLRPAIAECDDPDWLRAVVDQDDRKGARQAAETRLSELPPDEPSAEPEDQTTDDPAEQADPAAGGTDTQPPAEQAEAGPIVMIAQRQANIPDLYSRQVYEPGRIVPRPLERELRFVTEGAAEPLSQWWGGELTDPERIDGRLYPVLLRRPADRSLWLRVEPHLLQPLAQASRSDALTAVHRCRDRELLAELPDWDGRPEIRQAAELTLAGDVPPETPLALVLEGGRPAVRLLSGITIDPGGLYAADLKPLIDACEDQQVLSALADRDRRPGVQDLLAGRGAA